MEPKARYLLGLQLEEKTERKREKKPEKSGKQRGQEGLTKQDKANQTREVLKECGKVSRVDRKLVQVRVT